MVFIDMIVGFLIARLILKLCDPMVGLLQAQVVELRDSVALYHKVV